MKIRKLKVEIYPIDVYGDAFGLQWEVYEDEGVLGYKKQFSGREVEHSNDWKSHWDYMWDIAKREFEKAQAERSENAR